MYLTIYSFIYVFTSIYLCIYISLAIFQSIYLCIYISLVIFYLSMHLYVYLATDLSMYLSLHVYTCYRPQSFTLPRYPHPFFPPSAARQRIQLILSSVFCVARLMTSDHFLFYFVPLLSIGSRLLLRPLSDFVSRWG